MKIRALFIIGVALALLTGCAGAGVFADYREVEQLEIIRTIGIDKGPEGVTVTADTGVEEDGRAPKLFRTAAPTLSAALEQLQETPRGRRMVFAHTEQVVIGETAARAGLAGYLDYIERATEMRIGTGVFIVRDGTAEDLLAACAGEGSSAADMLLFLKTEIRNMGCGFVYTCGDIAAGLASEGCALAQAVERAPGETVTEEERAMVRPAGFAVLAEGALAGYLTEEESRGAALLLGKVERDDMTAAAESGTAALSFRGAGMRVRPLFLGGSLDRLSVAVRTEAAVKEASEGLTLTAAETRRALAQDLAARETERAAAAVARSQAMGLDFLGLCAAAERASPLRFGALRDRGAADIGTMTVEVTVSAAVRRTFDVADPFSVRGKGA